MSPGNIIGGGGGACFQAVGGTGGQGGGGDEAEDGEDGFGGGSGGSDGNGPHVGGSGIVIVRYKK